MTEEEKNEQRKLYLRKKPFLRFRCGETVFLKSDVNRENPMTIEKIIDPFLELDNLGDYSVIYIDSRKTLKYANLDDSLLMPQSTDSTND